MIKLGADWRERAAAYTDIVSKPKVGDTVLWVDDKYEEHRSKVTHADLIHGVFLVDYPDEENEQPTTVLTSADIIDEDEE